MHIDLNSCFATIEQQANPLLRGKPIAVAAYATDYGCIIAPSVEAKRLGVKVGMRVKDGKLVYPDLVILPPDPNKYRNIHLALRKLISQYSNNFEPKSIDEFVVNLEGYPAFAKGMHNVAAQIKKRIKSEIGEAITVSVGIGPNRFLAKLACGLHKPDGLDEINKDNFLRIYSRLKLTDLCGIKAKNSLRLNSMGIYSVLDFYNSPLAKLKAAFHSILGYYWFLRLRGWEIDDVVFARRSYGNSYAFPKPFKTPEEIAPILSKLVQKMGFRLRKAGYKASGVHLAISFRNGTFWHQAKTSKRPLYTSVEIYKDAFRLFVSCPYRKPVRDMSVSVFGLIKRDFSQLDLFEDVPKKEALAQSQDAINERWGSFVIAPARMLSSSEFVPDRIAFGGVKELEEFVNAV